MKLLDSTIAIDYLRGHDPAVDLVAKLVDEEVWLGASEVVRFEVLAGARPGEEAQIESFFGEIGWVPVVEEISRRAAMLARGFRLSHSGIDAVDYLIAATALALDAELLTTNVRHFPMIEDLEPAY